MGDHQTASFVTSDIISRLFIAFNLSKEFSIFPYCNWKEKDEEFR